MTPLCEDCERIGVPTFRNIGLGKLSVCAKCIEENYRGFVWDDDKGEPFFADSMPPDPTELLEQLAKLRELKFE